MSSNEQIIKEFAEYQGGDHDPIAKVAPDYVDMLRRQTRLVLRLAHRAGLPVKLTDREYRRVTTQLLKALLGRAPTAEEIGQVCDW